MAEWVDVVATLILGAVGLVLAHSFSRQLKTKVAEKRFDSYAALWGELKVASPLRRLTREGHLTADERRALFDRLTDWYYDSGNGMLLTQNARNIYLGAKENLICKADELKPASLAQRVRASDVPDTVRGNASIRQLSLLRTQTRADIEIYSSPWGKPLEDDDEAFLKACEVDLAREPWRSAARARRRPTS